MNQQSVANRIAVLIKHKENRLKEEIEILFDEAGFKPSGAIFIKPNLCARKIKTKSENSDPDFFDTLLEVLLDHGCKVQIGHTALLGNGEHRYPFEDVIRISGFERFRVRNDVSFVDLDKAPKKKYETREMEFSIPEIVLDSKAYINLSKMKTHMQTAVSLSLKNQMGLIPTEERKEMHRKGLGRTIARLATLIKPRLNIIDGIVAMEGDGPHHGIDLRANMLICGSDMVATDSLACEMMGIPPNSVEHICKAAEFGAGSFIDEEGVRKYSKNAIKFKKARDFIKKGLNLSVWPSSGCPGCYLALEEASKELMRDPMLFLKFLYRANIKGLNIVYGNCSNDRGVPGSWGFGKCSKKYCQEKGYKHLDGCPLSKEDVIEFFRKNL